MPWQQKSPPDSQPQASAGGRPPALQPEHIASLHDIVTERAQASLQEIADELHHRCGVHVCTATIRRALRAHGIVRLEPIRRVFTTAAKGPKRYGYTAEHWREDVPTYSTNLTDAEWELVAYLFERPSGQRGTPVHYSWQELVDACSYILRTACAWRLLPPTFPPWQAVYKAFARWAAAGVFEQMQDRLRQQWRARMGARVSPQRLSVMRNPIATRRRVVRADSMQPRRSKVESATSSAKSVCQPFLQQLSHQLIHLDPTLLGCCLQLFHQVPIQLHRKRHQSQRAITFALFAAVGRGSAAAERCIFRTHLALESFGVALGHVGSFHRLSSSQIKPAL